MKFANISLDGQPALAVQRGAELALLPADYEGQGTIASLEDLLDRHPVGAGWEELAAKLARDAGGFAAALPGSFRWRPIVERPQKIICVGLNYGAHIAETGNSGSEQPVLFSKFANALAAHDQPIPIPAAAQHMDYEAELVIVMGRRCHQVPASRALQYVLGYTTGNDVSARDLQHRSGQWLIGKSLDAFGPVGPYCTTADEVGDPQRLAIQLTRNGTLCQDANTQDMIFSCAEIVAYASTLWTLLPGDILFTGTPNGVINGMPPESQHWLAPGDQVAVTIEKLGTLANTFTGPRAGA